MTSCRCAWSTSPDASSGYYPRASAAQRCCSSLTRTIRSDCRAGVPNVCRSWRHASAAPKCHKYSMSSSRHRHCRLTDFSSQCTPGSTFGAWLRGRICQLVDCIPCDLGKSKRTLRSIGCPGPKTREGQRRKDECDQTAQTLKHTASNSSTGVSLVGREQS